MVEAMIGRSSAALGRPEPPGHTVAEAPALRWIDATGPGFREVSLEVRPGEVVALYGKLGSGAAELASTAYGLGRLESGRLEVEGAAVVIGGARAAIGRHIGFLPAERKAGGAFLIRSVAENVAVASWPLLSAFGVITQRREAAAYRRWHDRLSIRSRDDPRQLMGTLSGGNQQKVLLARWLERRSRALVLIEPTRGVDVGARSDIYDNLRELAGTGVAILVVTSDYEEAVQVADRTYVIAKGRVATELRGDDIKIDRLVEASGG